MSLLENSGKLEDLGLPELLNSICGPRETGVLRLTRHGVTKSIYIQEGRIVFAISNDPDDRLGELLLRKGLLRIQHFEDASARLNQRKRLGALLVEMGSLRPEELVKAVVEQVKQIVFDLFLWFDGDFSFTRGELPSREVITLKLSTPEVILGGIQRIDHWSHVLRGVGGLDSVYQACGGRESILQQMRLRSEHAALLKALEQPMSVRDLCRKGMLADFEVCRTLWAFRVIGLVEPSSPSGGPRESLDTGLVFEEAEAPANAMTTMMPAIIPPPSAPPAAARKQAPAPPPRAQAAGPATARPAAPPAAPARARRAPDPEPLDAGLGLEDSSPAPANAMTMMTPAASPRARKAQPAAAPPAHVAQASDSVDESVLEIVEVDEGPAQRAGAAAGDALDEAKVEAALAAFNDRHRRLHALLQQKAGPKAADAVKRSLATLEQDLPGLFNGIVPGTDGGFDLDALKMNIFAFGVVGYAAGLDMLIEREIEIAGTLLGPEVRRHITSGLKTVPA